MSLLITGILIWSLIHFLPSLGQGLRRQLQAVLGAGPYKGLFSLAIVSALLCIIFGWRSITPTPLYAPPEWGRPIALILMVLAFILFGASHAATAIKRFIRHPQLISVIIWCIAHFLVSGDDRALVLFGGMGLWAIISIPAINAREGEWLKPEAPAISVEIKGLLISLVIFVIALLLHPFYTGVSPIPG